MIKRLYPIRTTRKKWKINLFCYHKCTENCNIILVTNNNNQYILINNPEYINGECKYNNQIQTTTIRLSTFDINNPFGNIGPLCNADMKVIVDNEFKVSIYFPLSHVFEFIFSSPLQNGFTLKDLIYSIKSLYEYIYEEEERTSIPQEYNLKKFCTSCGNKDLTKILEPINETDIKDDCAICYSDYENTDDESDFPIKIKCGHIYHNNCLKKWTYKSGTCPICRYNIFNCDKCDGNGIIFYTFTGVVIPLEERNMILNRNQTNGTFGIYAHDFEDLCIENMVYDRTKKRLYIEIIA